MPNAVPAFKTPGTEVDSGIDEQYLAFTEVGWKLLALTLP